MVSTWDAQHWFFGSWTGGILSGGLSCYLFNRNSQVLILFRFLPTATCPGKSGLHFHRLIHPHKAKENDISWHLRKVHLPREQVRHTICALLKLCWNTHLVAVELGLSSEKKHMRQLHHDQLMKLFSSWLPNDGCLILKLLQGHGYKLLNF